MLGVSVRRARRTFKPTVESFEQRITPSTYTVTNLSGNPATQGSLPWAVAAANETLGSSTIDFTPGLSGTITVSSPMVVNRELHIYGPGQSVIHIGGGNSTYMFDVSAGALLGVYDLYLGAGRSTSGGAIVNRGTCYAQGDYFTNNHATGGGGAIHNLGYLFLSRSGTEYDNFYANTSDYAGGAIANYGQLVTQSAVFMTGNSSQYGGAIYDSWGASMDLSYSYFAQNTASVAGGALMVLGYTHVTNTNIINNFCSTGQGGGINAYISTLDLGAGNSIYYNTPPDIYTWQ